MSYQDLLKDVSESKDDGNYFLVTITDLDLGTAYPLQFRWKNKNGTFGSWSPVKSFTTQYATIPSEPNLGSGDVVGEAGFIKVTWNGNNALSAAASNFDRVNIHISGSPFGDGTKPSGFFKEAGTQTFAAPAGVYIVQLKILTVNGSESLYSIARTVTVTSVSPPPEASVTPSTPTVSSVLGAIQLSWNGKTSTGTDQPFGFNAAKVYVGTSAGFTPSSSNQVDVLNFANGQNTLNIGLGTLVNGVALNHGIDYYVKIATTNGTDTSTAVSATGNPVRVGQVQNGSLVTITADKIATGVLSAGAKITAGAAGGKRVELNGTGDTPFAIYGTGGTKIFDYNATSNKLTIVGDGTFTGDISGATGTLTNALNVGTISGGLYPFSVSSSGVMRAISGTIGGLTLAADAIQNTGNTFRLDSSGIIRAGTSGGNSVIISPSLGIYHSIDGGSTTSGRFTLGLSSSTISGWTINTDSISSPSGNVFLYSAGKSGDASLRIQAGSSGQFRVYDDGSMYAATGTFGGSLSSATGSFSSGSIGGLTVNANTLSYGGMTIFTSEAGFGLNYSLYDTGKGIRTQYLTVGDSSNNGTYSYPLSSSSLNVFDKATFYNTVDVSGSGSLTLGSGSVGTNGNVYTSNSSGTSTSTTVGAYLSSNGYVLGRRASGSPLIAHRTDSNGNIIQFLFSGSSGGFITGSTSVTPSFTGTSDYRAKKDIEDYSGALDLIKQTRPRSFIMKNDPLQKIQVGFIAHEFAEVFPDFVFGQKDALDEDGNPDYQSLSTTNLIPYLMAAVKEMSARLDALEG